MSKNKIKIAVYSVFLLICFSLFNYSVQAIKADVMLEIRDRCNENASCPLAQEKASQTISAV